MCLFRSFFHFPTDYCSHFFSVKTREIDTMCKIISVPITTFLEIRPKIKFLKKLRNFTPPSLLEEITRRNTANALMASPLLPEGCDVTCLQRHEAATKQTSFFALKIPLVLGISNKTFHFSHGRYALQMKSSHHHYYYHHHFLIRPHESIIQPMPLPQAISASEGRSINQKLIN